MPDTIHVQRLTEGQISVVDCCLSTRAACRIEGIAKVDVEIRELVVDVRHGV